LTARELASRCLFGVLACGADLSWRAALLLQRDSWREQDAQGRPLLQERGPLQGASLGVEGRFGAAEWAAQAQYLGGERHYEGQTNQGSAVLTRSDVHDLGLRLDGRWALAGPWRAVLALQPSQVQRNLHGTPNALGYRETWQWTLAEAGLRWQPGLRLGWAVEGAAGLGLDPRVRFTLPGMDSLTLRPGQGRSARVGVLYRGALGESGGAGWRWVAGMQWMRLGFAASAPEPLTSNGVLRGGASQPKTTVQATHWRLGIEADLP